MKNTVHKHAETLKKHVDGVAEKSRERMKHLVDANSKHFENAVKANAKNFDAVSKMLYEKELDPSIVSAFKNNFIKSLKLSEETIDSIIDSSKERVGLSIDFTTKFADAIKHEDLTTTEGVETLIEMLKENIDKSTELSLRNMEKVTSIYNDHLNLVLGFNKRFAETINSQVLSLFKMQKRTADKATSDIANEWWKATHEEKETV